VGCGLGNHQQDAGDVLCLKPLDNLCALCCGYAAMDALHCVSVAVLGHTDQAGETLRKFCLQHVHGVPVRHKHKHLVARFLNDFHELIAAIGHVKLNHVSLIRIGLALRH